MENPEHKKGAADLASEAAFELEISRETRGFLRELSERKPQSASIRPLFLAGIAASLLAVIASVVTINISHSDSSLAAKYGINALVARSGDNVDSDEIREAVQAYYAEDYEDAKGHLKQVDEAEKRLGDYKDWLTLLIELQTSGSKSAAFKNELDSILVDEDHEFYLQAVKIKRDVALFWRAFILKK